MKIVKDEKGIALVLVLILSLITLAMTSGLIYMLTSETEVSGIQKRYNTALEAGMGASDFSYQVVALRGDATDTNSLVSDLSSIGAQTTTPAACVTDLAGTAKTLDGRVCSTLGSYTNIATKLLLPTECWSGCDDSLTITPGACTNTTSTTGYDLCFTLGANPAYTVYAKIANTTEGNSGAEQGLLKTPVVSSNTGEITPMHIAYQYTIEVDAENQANPEERAKLSILYEY
jgi:hypothetical protein